MTPKLEAKSHVQDIIVQPTAGGSALSNRLYSTLSTFHAIKRLPVTHPSLGVITMTGGGYGPTPPTLSRYSSTVQNKRKSTTPTHQEQMSRLVPKHPRLEQSQVSHSGRGKQSSFVRHLIWLRKDIGFQVSVRAGFSPGSISIILWTSTDA